MDQTQATLNGVGQRQISVSNKQKSIKVPPSPQSNHYRQTTLDFFFAFVTLVFILLVSLFPLRSNDIWWHMAVGKKLLTSQHFITKDPFTFTVTGNPWVPHSYIAGIIFYVVHQIGSAYGLILLRVVLVLCMFVLLFRILKRADIPFSFATPFIILGALVVQSRFLLRPHLFEYVFIVILLGLLLDRKAKTGIRFYALPVLLQILWVNVHPSFYLGPMIVCLYLIGEAASTAVIRSKKSYSVAAADRLKRLSLLMLLMIAASLVNPSPAEFVFQPLGGEQRELVTRYTLEWISPFDPAIRHGALHPYYDIFLALTAVSLVLSLIRMRFAAFLLVGVFVYLSLQAHRFRAELVFIALPLLLIELKDAPFVPALKRLVSRWRGAHVRGIFALIWIVVFGIMARDRFVFEGAVLARQPVKAFEFIERENIAHRPFHTIGFGSYLLWSLYPERRSFIDGRNFDASLYKDFIVCQTKITGFQRIVEKYNLDAFILPVPERSDAGIINLHNALDQLGEWALVHMDTVAYIYARTDEVPRQWLDKNAYLFYRPMTFRKKGFPEEQIHLLVTEIERAIGVEPRMVRLWGDLAITCMAKGDYSAARHAAIRAMSIDPEDAVANELLRRLQADK